MLTTFAKLCSIKGSLNLISAERIAPLPHKIKHLIKIAEDESNRMIRLINDLLDLAKIEAKSYELEKDWYLVDDVIQGAKEALVGLSLNANECPQPNIPTIAKPPSQFSELSL